MADKFSVNVDVTGAKNKTRAGLMLPGAVEYQLTKYAGMAEKKLKQATQGEPLKSRSGHLRRNIRSTVTRKLFATQVEIGTRNVKYARIQDEGSGYLPGGVIKPKNKEYLTIPLGKTKGRAANFPKAFIVRSKKGNLLIAERKGKKGIKPLFKLQKSVKLEPTGWFSDTIEDLEPTRRKMLSKAMLIQVAKRGV